MSENQTKSETSTTSSCHSSSDRNSDSKLSMQSTSSTGRQRSDGSRGHVHLAVMFCLVAIMGASSPCGCLAGDQTARSSQAAGLLQGIKGAGRLAQKLDLAKSSGQLGEWMVQQVAPAVATKLIDNVLHTPGGGPKKKSAKSSDSVAIDTQALADKIVDKLADSIKKKKQLRQKAPEQQPAVVSDDAPASPAATQTKGHSRRGKSLVSDSVHQVVQNLFAKDNRKLFGRAMEKSKLPFRLTNLHNQNQQQHQQQQHNNYNQSNSWMRVTEPVYDQHLFVSTDSSQLDENPVVLRAEHGHNLTTISPPPSHQDQYINQQQQQQQNLSPLISSLMTSSATNQMGQKLLQKHRLQQKYVHTNRHQQQHLSPKPVYPSTSSGRRPFPAHTQSPYSLSVTSDMNIVQAPSSPPPPPQTQPPVTTPSTTTTTSTTTMGTTTNPSNLVAPFSFVPHLATSAGNPATVMQLGPNKFKFNNRHQQPPNSVTLAGAPSSWYSSNRQHPYHMPTNQHHRHHHNQQSPTAASTTSTTTTTTTTSTTTPEPPLPQTEPAMTESLEPLMDLDQQSSGSSILGAAFESLANQASQSSSLSDNEYGYSSNSSSYGSSSSSSGSRSNASSSTGSIKAASPSTTTARHSVISAEAIPTALGAPLYHLTRANFTATSLMDPPPRRVGQSPATKMAVQYFQKGLNTLSTNIFSRQNKNLARRLGLGSLLFGLLYGAAVLSSPGLPLPASGLELFQMLTKNKRRRGSSASLLPPVGDANKQQQHQQFAIPAMPLGNINPAFLDNNMLNLLYQQPQLIPVLEQILKQEQQSHQQQQQNTLFSQRSGPASIEIENFDQDQASRRNTPSQIYTISALPTVGPNMVSNSYGNVVLPPQNLRRR